MLLDRAERVQRNQVRAILQNRPQGDLAADGDSAPSAETFDAPETRGPDIVEDSLEASHSAPIQAQMGEAQLPDSGPRQESQGHRLPEPVQAKMEAAFGTSFSEVRIHEDGSAGIIGAPAYTQGDDIHFARGKYQPASVSGQEVKERIEAAPAPESAPLPDPPVDVVTKEPPQLLPTEAAVTAVNTEQLPVRSHLRGWMLKPQTSLPTCCVTSRTFRDGNWR